MKRLAFFIIILAMVGWQGTNAILEERVSNLEKRVSTLEGLHGIGVVPTATITPIATFTTIPIQTTTSTPSATFPTPTQEIWGMPTLTQDCYILNSNMYLRSSTSTASQKVLADTIKARDRDGKLIRYYPIAINQPNANEDWMQIRIETPEGTVVGFIAVRIGRDVYAVRC